MADAQYCPIYLVRERLGLQRPDEKEKRYHTSVFIALTSTDYVKIHITGSITDGFVYQARPESAPELSSSYHSKELLGYVRTTDYAALEATCRAQPVPTAPQQRWSGGANGGYRRCRENGDFFDDADTVPKLFRCTEWVQEYAVPAIKKSGLVVKELSNDATRSI